MATLSVEYKVSGLGETNRQTTTMTGTKAVIIDSEACPDSATTTVICAGDVSAQLGWFMMSTQDVSVDTDGAAQSAIALQANEIVVWDTSGPFANLLTEDFTQFEVTNASGSAAEFSFTAIEDATP